MTNFNFSVHSSYHLPCSDGGEWSEDAIGSFECFTNMSSWKQMLLIVVPSEDESSLPSVELFDPDNEVCTVCMLHLDQCLEKEWEKTVLA